MALSNNALTTVENVVKVLNTYPFLPEGLSFDDVEVIEEVERFINQWSSTIQTFLRRDLGLRERVEFVNGSMGPNLMLQHYPVQSLTSVERIANGGVVVGTLDVQALMSMISEDDLNREIIYSEPNFYRRNASIGIVPDPYSPLKSYKVTYMGGYVLPKDATVENPQTLPYDIEGLVLDLVKTSFIEATDTMRANNLITLTEGNIQRMWGAPVQFALTKVQEKTISSYRRMSV
jgi:hypothetical protein